MPTVSLPPETLLDGSTVEEVTLCLVDECAPDFCEFQAGTAVVDIAAGGAHVCARKASGVLRCWGFNSEGQLGYGHVMNLGDDEALSTIGNVPYE